MSEEIQVQTDGLYMLGGIKKSMAGYHRTFCSQELSSILSINLPASATIHSARV